MESTQTKADTDTDAELARALAEGIYGAYDSLRASVADLLGDLGLTEKQADVLWQLDPEIGHLSRRQLAERLHCDPSNITFLVDRLEEQGLVTRHEDSTDRRVKAVRLTPAGIDARRRVMDGIQIAPTFSTLSRDEREKLAALLAACLKAPGSTAEENEAALEASARG
jgi:DNA-binding MarR family transcriptional regulator